MLIWCNLFIEEEELTGSDDIPEKYRMQSQIYKAIQRDDSHLAGSEYPDELEKLVDDANTIDNKTRRIRNCGVCKKNVLAKDIFGLKCGHERCRKCLEPYLKAQLEDRKV